ncbi:MAG: D-tyrosyl-tRNA(Tyr) deacylase [Spirochaetaceae bacterium]|nr:D-tyrosyl-tRNA(Tyr) deacylase [Spirochaetaceae bacterium]
MRAIVQRVCNAQVSVGGVVTGRIAKGLLVYLGVASDDTEADGSYLAEKVFALRIFDDADGKMNLSVQDAGGSVLVVSQFTLLADARKGRRPSYSNAADPVLAKKLYEDFIEKIRKHGLPCETGMFQARMAVQYTNDGPVTVLLDSQKLF